jgi:YfiH family protein
MAYHRHDFPYGQERLPYFVSDLLPWGSHAFWGPITPDLADCSPRPSRLEPIAGLFDLPPERLVTLTQVHGTAIKIVTAADLIPGQVPHFPGYDGLVTAEPDIILAVKGADCVPILFWDARQGLVGAAHAGWRGVAANITARLMAVLQQDYRSDPADIHMAMGPSIQPCCFEIGPDAYDRLTPHDQTPTQQCFRPSGPEKWQADLHGLIGQQFQRAGGVLDNSDAIRLCTFCHPARFASFRRNKSESGRQLSVIKCPNQASGRR